MRSPGNDACGRRCRGDRDRAKPPAKQMSGGEKRRREEFAGEKLEVHVEKTQVGGDREEFDPGFLDAARSFAVPSSGASYAVTQRASEKERGCPEGSASRFLETRCRESTPPEKSKAVRSGILGYGATNPRLGSRIGSRRVEPYQPLSRPTAAWRPSRKTGQTAPSTEIRLSPCRVAGSAQARTNPFGSGRRSPADRACVSKYTSRSGRSLSSHSIRADARVRRESEAVRSSVIRMR